MKYVIMGSTFVAIVLTVGLVSVLGVGDANPSPEQWIAAAHDIEDEGTGIDDMTSREIEITSTAMQVEAFQTLNFRVGIGMWALAVLAAAVVVRVVFVDILGWKRKE